MPSTVISKFDYDITRNVLRVTFLSGAIYEYFEVPESIFKNMKEAFSKGEFLNNNVKNRFKFNRIQ